MPPIPLSEAATIVDSAYIYDERVIGVMEEEFLLVNSCTAKGTHQTIRESGRLVSGDTAGPVRTLLRIDHDIKLSYDIDAMALDFKGLADYAPGASLSLAALDFLTDDVRPFRFRPGGKLIYNNPTRVCKAGDLAQISFSVDVEFAAVDATASYSTSGSSVFLSSQAPAMLTDDAVEWVAGLVFRGDDYGRLTSDPLTIELIDGTGTSISTPQEVTPTITAIGDNSADAILPYVTIPSTGSSRTITVIRWAHGADICAETTLSAPVTLPAGSPLVIPSGNISVRFQFPAIFAGSVFGAGTATGWRRMVEPDYVAPSEINGTGEAVAFLALAMAGHGSLTSFNGAWLLSVRDGSDYYGSTINRKETGFTDSNWTWSGRTLSNAVAINFEGVYTPADGTIFNAFDLTTLTVPGTSPHDATAAIGTISATF